MTQRPLHSLFLLCAAALLAACSSDAVAVANAPPSGTITAPVAATTTIAPGGSVTFQATCADPEGDTVTHLWTFGGGAANSTALSPGAVSFANAGTYAITYTCTDWAGLPDPTPDTRTVVVSATPVNHAPQGTITSPVGGATIAPGASVDFQATCTDPDGDTVTHLWDFGGGAANATVESPGPVTFATAGTYTVTYTCTDSHGLADATPDTRSIDVVVQGNQAPNGTITAPAGAAGIPPGGSVTFAATCTDPEGDALTHAWDFGGGAAGSTAQDPGAVAFAAAGVYTVTYTCTDSKGLADPTPDTRVVTVSAGNHAPDGVITAPAAAATIAPGGSVTFAATCTDPDGDPVTHAWDFGGGAAGSTLQSPGAVTFAAAGVYTVTYTCTDSNALADPVPDTRTITVAVAGADRTLSGTITFDKVPSTPYDPSTGATAGLDYAGTVQRPVRSAELAVVEAANLANVLATGVTGNDGHYAVSWPASGPSLVLLIVYSRTHAPKMIVEDNTANNAVFALTSSTLDATTTTAVDLHAAHGWNGTTYATRAASPFAVLDSLWQAVLAFQAVRPSVVFPDLHANWSAINDPVGPQGSETDAEAYAAGHIGTSHWNGTELYLLGQQDVDTDEFDEHVVAHEWGHYFETNLGRSDSPGGAHGFGDKKDARLAFSEGWGNALSAIVWSPNAIYTDSYDPGQANGFGIDVDDNTAAEDPNPGWYSEASVQAILYDLFDAGTGEAFDTVSFGLGPIYDVQTTAQMTTPSATTLFSFIAALKAANPGSAAAIDALTRSRNVVGVPVADVYGTGETNNGGSGWNLPVYRSLTAGTSVAMTMTGANGHGNELGQNRYFRFVGDGASHTVSVATSNSNYDVDVVVSKQGQDLVWAWGPTGTESTPALTFESGAEYLIVVTGWGRANGSTIDYTTSVKVN